MIWGFAGGNSKVGQARAKKKAEEVETRRKALLGFASAMHEFQAISETVKDSTDAELAALVSMVKYISRV